MVKATIYHNTMVKYHSEKYHVIFVHGILYHTRYRGKIS